MKDELLLKRTYVVRETSEETIKNALFIFKRGLITGETYRAVFL